MFDCSPTAGLILGSSVETDPHTLFLRVCSANNVMPSLVKSPMRGARIVDIRRKVARVLRDAGCSYTEIGRILGGRHHATIMSLLNPDIGRRKYLPRKLSAFAKTSEAA